MMYEIVDEWRAGKYVLLSLDRPIEEKLYDRIEIDGKQYDIVPSYGTSDIAIESDGSFLGRKAKLVLSDKYAGYSV